MTEEQIQNLVSDVFELNDDKSGKAVRYADYVKIIVDHPIGHTFIMGGGTVQYGMGR